MKIAYFDNFTSTNSNGYWFEALKRLGEVVRFDVIPINKNRTWMSVPRRVKEFQPTHVHCGGSVKHGSIVSVGLIRWIRETFPGIRITYFFGDGYNKMAYYRLLEPYVDNIYMSNSEWCDDNKYKYMPCPAPRENEREWTDQKKYDIIFIGNNYNADRLRCLRALSGKYNVTIFGQGWPKDLNCPGSVSFEQYPDICSQAKIVIGDPAGPICAQSTGSECLVGDPDRLWTKGLCRAYSCSAYTELGGYLSNRLANTLIAGTVHLVPYVKGIEQVFSPNELVWYRDEQERDRLIDQLLADPIRCQQVALAGQKKILEQFTFDKCAQVFVGDNIQIRPIAVEDARVFSTMRNADDTFRWFFSAKKFTVPEVQKWISNLNPATDEVYMVELEGQVVGTCSIYNIDQQDKTAEIGRIIVEEAARGQGLGTRILKEVARICTTRGFKMIYANIKADNVRSQKAFGNAGFKPACGQTFYWRVL